MLCHVWEKWGIVFFKQLIFHMAILTSAPSTKELVYLLLWRADKNLSLWFVLSFFWVRTTKTDHGILIRLICDELYWFLDAPIFFQQNPTSFVVWLRWCSVSEQTASSILHFILTVILFIPPFTEGDLLFCCEDLRGSDMKKLLEYSPAAPAQLVAHGSVSLL